MLDSRTEFVFVRRTAQVKSGREDTCFDYFLSYWSFFAFSDRMYSNCLVASDTSVDSTSLLLALLGCSFLESYDRLNSLVREH